MLLSGGPGDLLPGHSEARRPAQAAEGMPSAVTLELEWARGSNTSVCGLVIGIEASFS